MTATTRTPVFREINLGIGKLRSGLFAFAERERHAVLTPLKGDP